MTHASPALHRYAAAFRLAILDLRAQRGGFHLYALALALGIGAMIAVSSFRDSVADAFEGRSKELLGADLSIRTRRALSDSARAILASAPGRAADEWQFRTMAWFPETERARFVQVRAIEPGYPFFGKIDTDPPDAANTLHQGAFALVEENALVQADAQIGSRIRIGSKDFTIVGKLLRAPGESPSEALIAPRVYIPFSSVEQTGLLQPGSVVSFRRYLRLSDGVDGEALADQLRRQLAEERAEIETAASRARALLGSVDSIARYLGLVGFVGLLLGAIGAAAAGRLYVAQRLPVAAMLKCIGAPTGFNEVTFLAQIGALGAAGALFGLGTAAVALPLVSAWMRDLLATEIQASLSLPAVLWGISIGFLFAVGWAALPLIDLRRVTPADALRRFSTDERPRRFDRFRLFAMVVLFLAVGAVAVLQTQQWKHGLAFAIGTGAAFAVIGLVARLLRVGARALASRISLSAARHALAGMDRPENPTGILMAAIGLGVCLVSALLVAERSIRYTLSVYREPDQPTLVLIDVQPDQRADLSATLARQGIPTLNETPIVAMRLDGLAGRDVSAVLQDPARRIPEWALRREYRATYRADLFPTERILEGQWVARWDRQAHPPGTPVPISIERSIAKTLQLNLGDEVEWDVQGVRMTTQIASVRDVDWRSMKPNFYIVFPEGVLEAAPQMWALFARADDAQSAANLQRIVANEFANVSVIDLALVLSSVNQVLGSLADAVRGIGWFVALAGLILTAGAVHAGRARRERERALLRALGAPSRYIQTVAVLENAGYGLFGGLAGTILGAFAGWAISTWALEMEPRADVWILLIIPPILGMVTALIGWLDARPTPGSPLDHLRRAAA